MAFIFPRPLPGDPAQTNPYAAPSVAAILSRPRQAQGSAAPTVNSSPPPTTPQALASLPPPPAAPGEGFDPKFGGGTPPAEAPQPPATDPKFGTTIPPSAPGAINRPPNPMADMTQEYERNEARRDQLLHTRPVDQDGRLRSGIKAFFDNWNTNLRARMASGLPMNWGDFYQLVGGGAGAFVGGSLIDPAWNEKRQRLLDLQQIENEQDRLTKRMSAYATAQQRAATAGYTAAKTANIPVTNKMAGERISNTVRKLQQTDQRIALAKKASERPQLSTKVVGDKLITTATNKDSGESVGAEVRDKEGNIISSDKVNYKDFEEKPNKELAVAEAMKELPDDVQPSGALWDNMMEAARKRAREKNPQAKDEEIEDLAKLDAWGQVSDTQGLASQLNLDPLKTKAFKEAVARAEGENTKQSQDFNVEIHRIEANVRRQGGEKGLLGETLENFRTKYEGYRAGKFTPAQWSEYLGSIYLK